MADIATLSGIALPGDPVATSEATRMGYLVDTAGRLLAARMPLVDSAVRSGTVSSTLTIDASTGAGNLVDLAITGNPTINISGPANHQVLTLHLLASGGARTVTWGAAIIEPPGVPGSVTIPSGAVLVATLEYIGNRGSAAWLLTRTVLTDGAGADTGPRCVGRNNKPSGTISVTTVEKRIVTCSAPIVAGRSYRVTARVENDGSVANMVSQSNIRFTTTTTTTGTEPLITSTLLARALMSHSVASVPDTVEVVGTHDATAAGTLTASLCVLRAIGSGTITVRADAVPIRIWIDDVGPTVTDAGTVYTT